jgi:hypothetical protein
MKLRDYQTELVGKAVAILNQHGFVYLTLETRTGKTPVSLMASFAIRKRVIFATKKSIMKDIDNTYLELCTDYQTARDAQLEVVSFDSLHKLKPLSECVIIADEAHSFGAFPKPSLRAKELRRISKGCPVIMLSATPTPESYSMIYHQLWAANAKLPIVTDYKNFYAWAKDYVKIGQKIFGSGMKVNDYSHAKAELITPHLEPISLSITKEQAGFAITEDDIEEIVMRSIIPEPLKLLIAKVKKDRIAYFEDYTILADTAAKLLSKEHQLVSGTVIPEDRKTGIIISDHKIKTIRFAMLAYKRVAIFYKFIAEKDMLMAAFGDRVTEDFREFNADSTKVFIGQFISKREGINLEQADAIICLNIDFAYLSYIQMVNRMMSFKRTKKPVLIWIMSDNGIEEDILRVVKKKKKYTTAYYGRRLKKGL